MDSDAKWLVCAVEADKYIDLDGKVKFPSVDVVYCGDREGAIAYLVENGGAGKAIVFSTLTGGDYSTLTGGYRSTLTGGDDSVLIIQRWNGKRYKYEIANVGENGIKPNTEYRLDEDGEFIEVTE
ncbi:hypothetical protein [Martelella alba]|uniref:Uncharacterized protein n=1 Tax=Martelella alba TaxID=2590451 RepID=A0ABY2SFW4_9HYPH|nr:hypothetical protein [Martelella alba]TKI03547.1 hypothetical protein FCN80_20935 [Martelella alba]